MGRYEARIWQGSGVESQLPRRHRKGGTYEVYIPDKLAGQEFSLGGPEAADVSDAERAVALLETSSSALADTEALARLLLRAESAASSKIEGLVVGARRLLEADAERAGVEANVDVTASEVLGNIDAMSYAIHAVDEETQISLPLLLETHHRLLEHTDLAQYGGKLRTVQNWIGGSSYTPISAAFVPPPPELVEDLLLDLCAFCNDDSLPPVAQAAIAHAQFETIHPFVDGNGRVGRALIHMVLRRRGLTHRVSPPISLVLATRVKDYINGLNATHYLGEPDSASAFSAWNQWIGTFASACTQAASQAMEFETRIRDLQSEWRQRLGSVRSGSAAERLIEILPGAPVITVSAAQKMLQRSLQPTLDAVNRLADAGILVRAHAGRQRKQIYEAREIISLFTALERQLASPSGDTQSEPPTRPVPAR